MGNSSIKASKENEPFVNKSTFPSSIEKPVDQIKTGDFNGDGAIDFVLSRIDPSNYYGSSSDVSSTEAVTSPLQIFLGDGKGRFYEKTSDIFSGTVPTTNFVPRMIIDDFNNDGVDDIFCIDNGLDRPPFPGGLNSLFLSSNGKLIDARLNLPQIPKNNHGASVGDVNRDGHLDILVNAILPTEGNDLQINNGVARFNSTPSLMPALTATPVWDSSQTIKLTNTSSGLIDVNKDGYVDMILGTWDTHDKPSLVLINNNGSFANSTPIALPRSGVLQESILGINPIDLNGDDLPDLAISITNGNNGPQYYSVGYVQLLVNLGNGSFRDETQIRMPQSKELGGTQRWYKSIDVVDFDRDGFSDLMIDSYASSPLVYLNDGHGNFNFYFKTSDGFNYGAAGDVNNDGLLDLITTGFDWPISWGFSTWINQGTNNHVYKANFGGEKLTGSSSNDTFYVRDGNNHLNGQEGVDKIIFSGVKDQYVVSKIGGNSWQSTSNKLGASTELENIERFIFSDGALAVDLTGSAGKAYRVYKAAFARDPMAGDQAGLGYWISRIDNGMDMVEVAARFIDSPEFRTLYGQDPSNADFLTKVYTNVLGRTPDQGGYDWWLNELNTNPSKTKSKVLADFAESGENQTGVASLIGNGIQYTEFVT